MKAIKNLVLMSATLFLCLTVNASCKKGTSIEPVDLSNPQAAAAQAKAQTAIAGMVEIIYENALKSGAFSGATPPSVSALVQSSLTHLLATERVFQRL